MIVTLTCNSAGRLQLTTSDGVLHDGVVPVRAFPIVAPEEGISLVDKHSQEVLWIPYLQDLSAEHQVLIKEALMQRELMPEILHICSVSSFATPSVWQLETNRGKTELTLKAEDHIRRLNQQSLLISDSHGMSFMIRDVDQLDRHSRKLLDRFL